MFQKEENKEDIRLAIAWQEGDAIAGEKLLLKYMPLIMKASVHNYPTHNWEDLRQELILTFLESTKNYSPIPNVPFAAFIRKKIFWARNDNLAKIQEQENHESLTLEKQEEPFYETEMIPSTLPDDIKRIIQIAHLTKKQQLIFPFWLEGKNISYIHQHTGLSPRSIQRLIVRMLQALRSCSHEISLYLAENY